MNSWFYGQNGTQLGPFDDAQLQQLIAQGQITPATLLWREGMPTWLPLHQINLTAAPAEISPQTIHHYLPPPTSNLAVASMVCGICGLLGMGCLLPASIAAVICGHMALNRIFTAELPIGGRGMAIAGLICGYLAVLPLIAMVVAFTVPNLIPHP